VLVGAEIGIRDGGPIHHRDADPVECFWQERPGSGRELSAATRIPWTVSVGSDA
jgi:hypothetical protein